MTAESANEKPRVRVMASIKPPPIMVGVQGIERPKESEPGAEGNAKAAFWRGLVTSPPFQMFVAEKYSELQAKIAREKMCAFEDVDGEELATALFFMFADRGRDEDLYVEYAAWHEVKGYWPNETPCGKVKQG